MKGYFAAESLPANSRETIPIKPAIDRVSCPQATSRSRIEIEGAGDEFGLGVELEQADIHTSIKPV